MHNGAGDALFPVFSFQSPLDPPRELGMVSAGYGLHAASLADILIDLHRNLVLSREVSGVEDRDKGALVGDPRALDALLEIDSGHRAAENLDHIAQPESLEEGLSLIHI